MLRIPASVAIALIVVSLVGCGDNPVSPGKREPRSLTPAEHQLVAAYNVFGLKLFREIVGNSPGENVFISPTSVSMALGMALNGAAGTTADAMESTLGFSGMALAEIDQSYRSLIDFLVNLDPKVQFQIANSIWYKLGWAFEQPFLSDCGTYFDAQATGLDFGSSNAAPTINAWVSQKTNGKITEIVDNPINPYTVMFLINAIYFKGTWTYEFDSDLTKDDQFTLPGGATTPCRMMQRPESGKNANFSYHATDRFQIIDLPYGDGYFTMTILLPAASVDLDSLIASLDQDTWNQWTSALAEKPGRIEMPKFQLKYETVLNDVLKAMGMEVAFDPDNADFTRMHADGELYINQVKHKTFVKVDEEGTEAAAVTSVGIGTTSAPDDFEMRVNRPFLFAIRENHSGTILFMGKITNPAS
ncbi:MAG TPA: serpin family protein [bacterium]|nr:serpin family protein [bacterium]